MALSGDDEGCFWYDLSPIGKKKAGCENLVKKAYALALKTTTRKTPQSELQTRKQMR
jgi:hypothetical protein